MRNQILEFAHNNDYKNMEQSINIFLDIESNSENIAELYHELGLLFLNSIYLEKALHMLQKEEYIRKKLIQKGGIIKAERYHYAKCCYYLGIINEYLNNIAKASIYYHDGLKQFQQFVSERDVNIPNNSKLVDMVLYKGLLANKTAFCYQMLEKLNEESIYYYKETVQANDDMLFCLERSNIDNNVADTIKFLRFQNELIIALYYLGIFYTDFSFLLRAKEICLTNIFECEHLLENVDNKNEILMILAKTHQLFYKVCLKTDSKFSYKNHLDTASHLFFSVNSENKIFEIVSLIKEYDDFYGIQAQKIIDSYPIFALYLQKQ